MTYTDSKVELSFREITLLRMGIGHYRAGAQRSNNFRLIQELDQLDQRLKQNYDERMEQLLK